TLDKVMSLQLDLDNRNLELLTLYGGWGAENHVAKRPLLPGIYVNDSKTGNSSNRHNPFFLIVDRSANPSEGLAYGFNLLYSGNHYEMVEATSYKKLRVQVGINPFLFHFELKPNQAFETPVAVMSVSLKGQNGLMGQFHRFVNQHIVRGPWADQERPVVLNNWEATYFDFSEAKLLALIHHAKRLGIELFVLDDGWFGRRKDDTQGLGDYDVNLKKLPHGLDYLADKVNDAGMKFGLWFEPEMVNESSKLFESHPEWAIRADGRKPSLGRHQMVLDLGRFEVQAYLVESISKTLDSAHIEYVKWDMNRHITDFQSEAYNQGEIYHRYVQGLYRVLKILTSKYDYVLWEGCASGGNRFDLGMLCYFQQIWTSDNTDAFERLSIQGGTSLGYPLSTISNHVSASPSHQMLRRTPIETRFHVASFGVLGYELDIRKLDNIEVAAIKDQISYYKAHRRLFQFGEFHQLKSFEKDGFVSWMVKNPSSSEAVVGYFIDHQSLLSGRDYLPGLGFQEDALYTISRREHDHRVKLFGGLINQVSPVHLNENGLIVNWIDKHRSIEQLMKMKKLPPLIASGAALNHGAVKLLPQWAGTGYNEAVRVLGDYGSELYYIKQEKVPD
ncbi:MAG: alpha-galactosidase, partial [Bacilli bacterium]